MICYSRLKNVLLLPCRHCSVCHACLRSLRDEKCPLCRSAFSSYVTLPICRAGTIAQSLTDPAASTGAQPSVSSETRGPAGNGDGDHSHSSMVDARSGHVHTEGVAEKVADDCDGVGKTSE